MVWDTNIRSLWPSKFWCKMAMSSNWASFKSTPIGSYMPNLWTSVDKPWHTHACMYKLFFVGSWTWRVWASIVWSRVYNGSKLFMYHTCFTYLSPVAASIRNVCHLGIVSFLSWNHDTFFQEECIYIIMYIYNYVYIYICMIYIYVWYIYTYP